MKKLKKRTQTSTETVRAFDFCDNLCDTIKCKKIYLSVFDKQTASYGYRVHMK
ncbi:MAG: hypothetical protein ABF289_19705 [Clostridiales bacterium]